MRNYLIRINSGVSARRDPCAHNARCPKLGRADLSGKYKLVTGLPSGYRPCRMCGG